MMFILPKCIHIFYILNQYKYDRKHPPDNRVERRDETLSHRSVRQQCDPGLDFVQRGDPRSLGEGPRTQNGRRSWHECSKFCRIHNMYWSTCRTAVHFKYPERLRDWNADTFEPFHKCPWNFGRWRSRGFVSSFETHSAIVTWSWIIYLQSGLNCMSTNKFDLII